MFSYIKVKELITKNLRKTKTCVMQEEKSTVNTDRKNKNKQKKWATTSTADRPRRFGNPARSM